MKQFLVCKDEETKTQLMANGFKLLKEEDGLYVFLNKKNNHLDFSKLEIKETNRFNL